MLREGGVREGGKGWVQGDGRVGRGREGTVQVSMYVFGMQ